MSEFRNSILAMGSPHCRIMTTVSTAFCTESNEEIAAAVASGIPCNRTVACVITPGVCSISLLSELHDDLDVMLKRIVRGFQVQ